MALKGRGHQQGSTLHLTAQWLDRFIDHYLNEKQEDVEFTVEKLRNKFPDLTDKELARKLREKMARRSGVYGAVTGLGEMSNLPLTVPISLVTTWKIQVKLINCIAYIFGYTNDPEALKRDIYLLLARQSFNTVGKGIGMQAARMILKQQLRRSMRNMKVRLEHKLKNQQQQSREEKQRTSVPDISKMATLAGAPIGFAYDYFSTRRLGTIAIRHYYSE